jgi:hypothetical protein
MLLEGDFQMPASNAQNDATLDNFFTVLNDDTSPNYRNLDYLMQRVFSPNGNPNPPYPWGPIPACGITDHGPQFIGEAAVRKLFQTLFTAFPDFRSTPEVAFKLPSKRMYSKDQTMITIQTTITGTQHGLWFQDKVGTGKLPGYYSPPISDIQPDGTHQMDLPVANVMTFDDKGKIVQLSMYFDRYRMKNQLFTGVTPPQATIFSNVVQEAIREPKKEAPRKPKKETAPKSKK